MLAGVYDQITDEALFEVEIEYGIAIDEMTGADVEGFIVAEGTKQVAATRMKGNDIVRLARIDGVRIYRKPLYLFGPTEAAILKEIRGLMA